MSRSPTGSDATVPDISLTISDPTQAGEARRTAVTLAKKSGFSETDVGRIALVVTELATNQVKHAGHSEILLRSSGGSEPDLEILALDKGPGIPEGALRDGYSTSGTPGTGLGAIQRLSDHFEIYTTPQAGTAILCRFGPSANRTTWYGVLSVPKPGEEVSGDSWGIDCQGTRCAILVADGLGHGPIAATASSEAVRIFREDAFSPPLTAYERIHAALRSTRGAAVGLTHLDFSSRTMTYAGVGNIAGTLYNGGRSRSAVSHNGTVGHEMRKVQVFEYPFAHDALLVLHSDGLATSWRLEKYPGLSQRDPQLIAGVLYRDFRRIRDDVTILVARLDRRIEE